MSASSCLMPDGLRYRISSQRRYIVVQRGPHKWNALYRTNDEGKALARWRHEGRYGGRAVHIVDITDGTLFR